jgi:hypothetical protein
LQRMGRREGMGGSIKSQIGERIRRFRGENEVVQEEEYEEVMFDAIPLGGQRERCFNVPSGKTK